MSFKTLCFWLLVAGGLFGAILLVRSHHRQGPPPGPAPVLSHFDPGAVTSVQVRPAGPTQLQIRADRTNDSWQLTEPLVYPAAAERVESLLKKLASLTPALFINLAEVRSRPKADEEYGFTNPQASLILQQGDYRTQVLVGAKTAPGDQVYLQVVGGEGVYVVNADLLEVLPRSANDWRQTLLVNAEKLDFDRVAVTNHGKALVLQRDPTNQLWRLVWPFTQGARADNAKIQELLQGLKKLRVQQFVSDDPQADYESLGLAPAELDLVLGHGTNSLVALQFGKSPTNDAHLAYGRRLGQPTVFTVPSERLAPWRESINQYRDPYLLSATRPLERIEIQGQDRFSLVASNQAWRIEPQHFPLDAKAMTELLTSLTNLQIIQFANDVVNPPDLPAYGLDNPVRRLVVQSACPGGSLPETNLTVEFGFGTNQQDRVFARRTDENSVYAISTNDFARLPAASYQLRERRWWRFTEDQIVAVTISEQGKTRRILRKGDHQWVLAPGSQGMINDLAVEETVRGLAEVSAMDWVGCGSTNRARFGFTQPPHQITFELKDGSKPSVEFGGPAPSSGPYAGVSLDGELWICEFPWPLYRDVVSYLSVQ